MSYPDLGQVKVADNVWLGCYTSSLDPDFLRQAGISLIINMTDESIQKNARYPTIKYVRFSMYDAPLNPDEADVYCTKFAGAAALIHRHLKNPNNGAVLVHCMAGINRSATVVALYLTTYLGMKCDEAVDYLVRLNQQSRNIPCLTNPDFRRLICELSIQH